MIDVGIDESRAPTTGMLVVSAIVGKAADMLKFRSGWSAELQNAGIDYFHAKEHWNGAAKPYHQIGRNERDRLLSRLVGHIHHRFLFGASVLIDETEYKGASSQRFQSQYGSPYGFAFQMLMVSILVELTRQRRKQPINILIEDGHANAKQAIGFIEEKRSRDPRKGLTVASYALVGKTKDPILQAADLLAYGVCEFHTRGYSDFMCRLAPAKYRRRFLTLPLDRSTVDAAKTDIMRHHDFLTSGAPGAKRRADLVMW